MPRNSPRTGKPARVWISYAVPFIIPITAGFITAVIFGDFLFAIMKIFTGGVMRMPALKFENGLIPVIVQDAATREVLMMAYANEEAVRLTQETGFAHYYSRSRKKLWKKGEESGHFQKVVRILTDCDEDCLIYEVAADRRRMPHRLHVLLLPDA